MKKQSVLRPLDASIRLQNELFADYPLRYWGVVQAIQSKIKQNICGDLCSLRFTWQRPKKMASDKDTFLFCALPWLIDAAWVLADAPLSTLHIQQVPNKNNLFALAMFENEVAVEIEMNECLPDSMPASYFIKANFTNGHTTNQPIVGHFNEEGSVFANDESMKRIVVENSEWDVFDDEIELCHRKMFYTIEHGAHPPGPLNSKAIINAIQEALA